MPEFSDKQHFLNTVYERFFQGYSVKVADTHGIVYTPQPIVAKLSAAIDKALADPDVRAKMNTADYELAAVNSPDDFARPVAVARIAAALSLTIRNSLSTLVSQTERFTDSRKAADAYAEAWALTYFLAEKHPEEYVAYLKRLATKQPLIWDEPEARLADFKAAFGDKLPALDAEFLHFMRSLAKR